MENDTQNRDAHEGDKHRAMIEAATQEYMNRPGREAEYIDAIWEYLGYDVEVGPITDTHDGIDYTFDFYDPETGRRFKVLTSFDEKTHRLYADCPSKPILIYDSPELALDLSDHESDEDLVLLIDEATSKAIYRDRFVFVYDSGRLRMYGGHPEGDSVWRKMPSFLTYCLQDEIFGELHS